LLRASRTSSAEQANFVSVIQNRIDWLDEKMLHGEWKVIRTTADKPFIISDAPVVTWQRQNKGLLDYGIGFHRPEVEVLLPISPSTCLHILPAVPRNQVVAQPTVEEVNTAQAAFASFACYANCHSTDIDQMVQVHMSTARIGANVFTLWHRNLDTVFYDILLRQSPFK